MSKVYVFLADGFEEVEGLTAVDLLRRAQIETEMVSVTGKLEVTGSHRIQVKADCLLRRYSKMRRSCMCCREECRNPSPWGTFRDWRHSLNQRKQKGKKWRLSARLPAY